MYRIRLTVKLLCLPDLLIVYKDLSKAVHIFVVQYSNLALNIVLVK